MPRFKKGKLNDRYMLLVDKYFELKFDQTAAVAAAGFKSKANAYSARLFRRPEIQAEIAKRQKRLREKHELTQDWVIERLMAIADSGRVLAKYKIPQPDGTLAWDFRDATEEDLAAISELSVDFYTEGKGDKAEQIKKFKVSVSDPKGALDSLARHLGLFNDKMTVQGEVSLVERLQKGRDRVKK